MEKLRKLKKMEGEDELSEVTCDILRALAILHGSAWDDELMGTLYELWSLKGKGMELESLVSKALKMLNEESIVISEKRIRADLGKGNVPDKLHRVNSLGDLLSEFGGDVYVNRYRREYMGYPISF